MADNLLKTIIWILAIWKSKSTASICSTVSYARAASTWLMLHWHHAHDDTFFNHFIFILISALRRRTIYDVLIFDARLMSDWLHHRIHRSGTSSSPQNLSSYNHLARSVRGVWLVWLVRCSRCCCSSRCVFALFVKWMSSSLPSSLPALPVMVVMEWDRSDGVSALVNARRVFHFPLGLISIIINNNIDRSRTHIRIRKKQKNMKRKQFEGKRTAKFIFIPFGT